MSSREHRSWKKAGFFGYTSISGKRSRGDLLKFGPFVVCFVLECLDQFMHACYAYGRVA